MGDSEVVEVREEGEEGEKEATLAASTLLFPYRDRRVTGEEAKHGLASG